MSQQEQRSRLIALVAALSAVCRGETCGNEARSSSSGLAANLALGGAAVQSSTAYGAIASLAVDGGTSARFWEGGSCTHTEGERAPWWAVALGGGGGGGGGTAEALFRVGAVRVQGREDECCRDWLRGLRVVLFNVTGAGAAAAAPGNGLLAASAAAVAEAAATVVGGGIAAASASGAALSMVVCDTLRLGTAAAEGDDAALHTAELLPCAGTAQALLLLLPPPLPTPTPPPPPHVPAAPLPSSPLPSSLRALSLCEVEAQGWRLWPQRPRAEVEAAVRLTRAAPSASAALLACGAAAPFAFSDGAGSSVLSVPARLRSSVAAAAVGAADRMRLFDALPARQRAMLGPLLAERRARFAAAAALDAAFGAALLGAGTLARKAAQGGPATLRLLRGRVLDECASWGAQKWEQIRYHAMRDWSELGAAARRAAHEPVLRLLRGAAAGAGTSSPPRVLLPGAGLGRLGAEIAGAGFDTVLLECDPALAFATAALVDGVPSGAFGGGAAVPLAPEFDRLGDTMHGDARDQFRSTGVPDEAGRTLLHRLAAGAAAAPHHGEGLPPPAGELSLVLGTLQHTFAREVAEAGAEAATPPLFDVVVTCFFIDTGNALAYLEVLHALLRVGGLWINFGPLHYPFTNRVQERGGGGAADEERVVERSNTMAVPPLSFAEIRRAAEYLGFEFEEVSQPRDFVPYGGAPEASLAPEVYRPVLSSARRVR
jgi:hypothetical protein